MMINVDFRERIVEERRARLLPALRMALQETQLRPGMPNYVKRDDKWLSNVVKRAHGLFCLF